jgi:predicted nucleic-acid-binding protein
LRDDDPVQSKKAVHFIQRAVRQNEPLYLSQVVLCELVWILSAVYDHRKEEIIARIEAVLLTSQFQLDDKPSIELALDDYRTSKADFADCLIGRRNRAHGSKLTLSFDRRLKGLDTFEVV